MASPLTIFRKYQYWFLVVLGVMLMVAFVVAPPIEQYLSSRQMSGGALARGVVMRWDGGTVREMDMRSLFTAHVSTLNFLQAVVQETQKRGGQPKAPLPFRSTSEQGLIETMLLAKKAENLGLVISDDAVADYLDRLCDQLLDHNDLNKLLRQTAGGRLSAHHLTERLKQELKAMYMQQIALSGVVANTPAKNLEHFNRMQERVTLEMLPLKVSEFVAEVTQEPSDADIQALYDKYKDNYPNPASPDPGFRRLPTTDFAYLRLNFNDLLEAEKAKITEAEIVAEYEAGLKRGEFRRPTLPPATTTPPADATTPPASDNSDKPPAPPETTPAADKPPAPPETTPDGDKPPAPPEPKPADADKPPAPPETPSTPPPAPNGAAAALSEFDALFVAVQDPPAGDAPATPAPTTPAPAPSQDPPTTPPTPPTTPSGDTPPAPASETPAAQPDTPSADKPAEDVPAPAGETATPAAEQNKTLEEVRDQIATKLARPKAQERRNKLMEDVRRDMELYFQQYTIWKQQIEGETMKEPVAPKLEDMAQKYGMTPGRTGPVDFHTVGDTDLGKTSRFDPQTFSFRPFREVGFATDVPLFRPREIRDAEDTDIEYVYWKVDVKDEYVPELKDIRDEVVATWKRMEARKLAEKKAEELRKQAAAGMGSLKEQLPGHADQIFTTNEFSWLTMGMGMLPQMSAPQLSSVEGVDSVNWDFMKTVFDTEQGAVNVVADAPHSTIYVFTMVRRGPETDVQRQRFLRTFFQGGNEFAALMQSDYQEYYRTWYQQLEREMNVRWERSPE